MVKSTSELRACELQSEVKKANDEIAILKSQLEETISAADKCIEELEEQVRRYEDEKLLVKSTSDKRVVDLEDVLRKVRDDKALIEGRLSDAELEVKRQREEVATQVARNNFAKAEADNRVALLEDKLRVNADDVVTLRKQLEALGITRDAAERSGVELKGQIHQLTGDLASSRSREKETSMAKETLQKRVSDLEKQAKTDKDEIFGLVRQLQDINNAKANALQGLDSMDQEHKRGLEEIARLLNLLQEANTARASEEQRATSLSDQLKTANEEIAVVARKANDAKSASEEMMVQLETRNKQLSDTLAAKDKDVTQSSVAKATGDKVIAELKAQIKKTADSLAACEGELQKVAAGKTSAEKALAEMTAERQKAVEDHAVRVREIDAVHSTSKFEADKHVGELKAQVRKADEELLVRVRQLSDMTVAKAAAERKVVDVEAKMVLFEGENGVMKAQLEELLSKQAAEERKDRRRIGDLREVNDQLLQFARNRRIQDILKRPYVKVALACWGGASHSHSDAELDAVRNDEGVVEFFPLLKKFEEVCDKAKIKFPVDHIEHSWTELSEDAVTYGRWGWGG